MYTFGELSIGDMFNTISARWVKIDDSRAICVMSSIHKIGDIKDFNQSDEVILLWSCVLREKK